MSFFNRSGFIIRLKDSNNNNNLLIIEFGKKKNDYSVHDIYLFQKKVQKQNDATLSVIFMYSKATRRDLGKQE